MKKILATFAAVILLTSCGGESRPELKQPRNDLTFEMTVHIVPESKIEQTCQDLGVAYDANGCAAFDLDKKTCDIYVMPQRWSQDEDRLIIIGHETWHCAFGKWHD